MACACSGGNNANKPTKYAWSNGSQSKTYNNEVEAQARKNRDGGNYRPVAG